MAPKQETASNPDNSGKDLVNQDGSVTKLIEWATESAATPEQILDMFLEAEIPVSHGEEITGDYLVIHSEEKTKWCNAHLGKRLFAVQWNFWDSSTGEFVSVHIVSDAGKFILNDGAEGGIYGQLRQITDKREAADPKSASTRTSTAGLMVAGGLRANKQFFYSQNTKQSIPKSELGDYEKYPEADRSLSKPTWSFDL
jgi:hypothetical protein